MDMEELELELFSGELVPFGYWCLLKLDGPRWLSRLLSSLRLLLLLALLFRSFLGKSGIEGGADGGGN
jgi:hypothetical protein